MAKDAQIHHHFAAAVEWVTGIACDLLLRCVESSHWGTKVEAAQALALGDARKWDFLVQALGENNGDWTSYYRPGIALAIAGSGDPRAVDVLLECEALERIDKDSSRDEYLLVDLIESLASIGDPRAIEPIRRWQHFEFEWREDVVYEAFRKLADFIGVGGRHHRNMKAQVKKP